MTVKFLLKVIFPVTLMSFFTPCYSDDKSLNAPLADLNPKIALYLVNNFYDLRRTANHADNSALAYIVNAYGCEVTSETLLALNVAITSSKKPTELTIYALQALRC